MSLSAYFNVLELPSYQFGPALSALFRQWRAQDDFDNRDFTKVLEQHFGEPHDQSIRNVTLAALTLANEKNFAAYHSHHHNREVTALTLALLDRHNAISEYPTPDKPPITTEMAWLSVAAAAIHDYKHDGTGNKQNGVVVPMRLEKDSLNAALPHLLAAGLTQRDFVKISLLILPTDITATEKPSPSAQLRGLFKDSSAGGIAPAELDPLLFHLSQDPELTACARMISDADLGVSAALDMEMARLNSSLLEIESNGAVPATPQSFDGFLTYVCAGFPQSASGREILQPGLEKNRSDNKRLINTAPQFNKA